jgi:predicted dehydrogenase
MRRTYASSLLARRILREGWLGPPRRIRVSEGGRTTKTGVDASHFDPPAGPAGGVLLDLGCHALDLAFDLTGARGHRVLRQDMVLDGKMDRHAEGEVALDLGGETTLPLHYTFSWLDRQEDVLEIEFSTARLRLSARPERPPALLGLGRDAKEVHLAGQEGGATTSNQAFYLEWRWVLDGIRSGAPSPLAAASCLPVTALLEDLYAASGAVA